MNKLLEISKDEIERIRKEYPNEELAKNISRLISTDDEMTCVVITQIFLERMIEKLFEMKMNGSFWKESKLKWNYRTQILALNQLKILDDKFSMLLNNFQSLRNKYAHEDYLITENDMKKIATNDELSNPNQINLACISLIMVLFGKDATLIDSFSETLGNARKEKK